MRGSQLLILISCILSVSCAFIAPKPNRSMLRRSRGFLQVRRRFCILPSVNSHNDLQNSSNDEDDDDENDEDEEEENRTPYGNRSLAWTNKYRKLLPYEYARATAMQLGLRSKEEWDDYLADGKVYHGPYLPSRPDEMYADDWVSWEEFLGIMRPYDEARYLVQNVLRLCCMQEYENFVHGDVKRAEGLRIPAKPQIVYRDKGWISEEHFFNAME